MVYLKINLVIFEVVLTRSHQMVLSLENLRNLKHEVKKMADLAKHFAQSSFLPCRGKLSHPNTVLWLNGCPKWSERLCLDGGWVECLEWFREGVWSVIHSRTNSQSGLYLGTTFKMVPTH